MSLIQMPSMIVRFLIAGCWLLLTGSLIYRDVLPGYLVGTPPDWRSISSSARQGPTRWIIMAQDKDLNERVIGQASSESVHHNDGMTELKSNVRIDAKGLFQGTPLSVAESAEFQFVSNTRISPQGLLDRMRAEVRVLELGEKPVLTIQAIPASNNSVEIKFQSDLTPLLTFRQILRLSPKDLFRGGLEPVEFLPDLRVGQTWNTQILQPMTARSEQVRSEVTGMDRLFWNGNPTEVFVVEHKTSSFSAKTFVTRNGLVIRQQLPTPLVRLILEREPEPKN